MVDPFALIHGVVAPLRKIQDAVNGCRDVKTIMRRRYGDYWSAIEPLQSNPSVVSEKKIERELERLKELFENFATLLGTYTAAPGDSRGTKTSISTARAADYKKIEEELKAIDVDVTRQLNIISVKTLLQERAPRSLPPMAEVPVGAACLPDLHVPRDSMLQEIVDSLQNPSRNVNDPYVLLGGGGVGKTILASSVVRDPTIRKHFHTGVHWLKVGQHRKNHLHVLLQRLAWEMADTPRQFHSVHGAAKFLATLVDAENAPRLVVLDDVWDREVLDILRETGLQFLVTTRIEAAVAVSGGCTKVGDMTQNEAVDLLINASKVVRPIDAAARMVMEKVTEVCGFHALTLAIAGSISNLRGPGFKSSEWRRVLNDTLENKAKMQRIAVGTESTCLAAVLDSSFYNLSMGKQEKFLRLAVLPKGDVASENMLLNLWELEDLKGMHEEAEALVSRSLLQTVDGGYRVHDLLLDYATVRIKGDPEAIRNTTVRQAKYLVQIRALEGRRWKKELNDAEILRHLKQCRLVDELSGDPELFFNAVKACMGPGKTEEETSRDEAYCCDHAADLYESLGSHEKAAALLQRALEMRKRVLPPDDLIISANLVQLASIYQSQGMLDEAMAMYEQSAAMLEKALGPEHHRLGYCLNTMTEILISQKKYAKAEDLNVRSLAISLGSNGEDLLEAYCNRAHLLWKAGSSAEAIRVCDDALASCESWLGPNHVMSMQLLMTKWGITCDGDDGTAIIGTMENVISMFAKMFGNEFELTTNGQETMMHMERMVHLFEQAEICFDSREDKPSFGPASALARTMGAVMLLVKGEYEQALPLLQMVVSELEAEENTTDANMVRELLETVRSGETISRREIFLLLEGKPRKGDTPRAVEQMPTLSQDNAGWEEVKEQHTQKEDEDEELRLALELSMRPLSP